MNQTSNDIIIRNVMTLLIGQEMSMSTVPFRMFSHPSPVPSQTPQNLGRISLMVKIQNFLNIRSKWNSKYS